MGQRHGKSGRAGKDPLANDLREIGCLRRTRLLISLVQPLLYFREVVASITIIN
jgi:hypothetical protein